MGRLDGRVAIVTGGGKGIGQAYATAYSIPAGSLPFWQKRFAELDVQTGEAETRFGEHVLTFFDPDGLRLELVATSEADPRPPARAAAARRAA